MRTFTAFAGGRVLVGGIIVASSDRGINKSKCGGVSFLSKLCPVDMGPITSDGDEMCAKVWNSGVGRRQVKCTRLSTNEVDEEADSKRADF